MFEHKLGRRLLPGEEAHHIDHNSLDDRPGNLTPLMRSEHSIETQEWMKRKRDEGKRRLFHLEIGTRSRVQNE